MEFDLIGMCTKITSTNGVSRIRATMRTLRSTHFRIKTSDFRPYIKAQPRPWKHRGCMLRRSNLAYDGQAWSQLARSGCLRAAVNYKLERFWPFLHHEHSQILHSKHIDRGLHLSVSKSRQPEGFKLSQSIQNLTTEYSAMLTFSREVVSKSHRPAVCSKSGRTHFEEAGLLLISSQFVFASIDS